MYDSDFSGTPSIICSKLEENTFFICILRNNNNVNDLN